MIEKYGVNIKTYYPDTTPEQQFQQYGRELYLRDGDYQLCCKLRKEQPYLKAVNNFDAMLSGLMRSEGGARKSIRIVTEDPRTDTYKVHPLANWTVQDVKRFIEEYDILVHPLHSKGYPSIGCSTCTTPVAPNEDERAGRWRHIREANPNGPQKLYCGINFSDVNHLVRRSLPRRLIMHPALNQKTELRRTRKITHAISGTMPPMRKTSGTRIFKIGSECRRFDRHSDMEPLLHAELDES